MPRSPAGKYGAELDTLRDQLIEAIRLRRLSALEAGLAVFEQLGEAILRRVAMINEVMGHRRMEVSWRQSLGGSRPADRLAPLSNALWPVIEQAVLSGDPQLTQRTLSTVNELARTARLRGDLGSLTDVVVLYPNAARRLHTAAPMPGAQALGVPELAEQLLRVVQTIHFQSRTGDTVDSLPYQVSVLKQVWDMARFLIDESDAPELERWANAYEEALALPLHGNGEASEALAVLSQAGVIALRGWVLLSWQEEWRPLEQASALALYSALGDVGEPDHLWDAVVGAAGDQREEQLGFGWWESLARPSGHAYWMTFGTYREDAAAVTLLQQAEAQGSIPRAVDIVDMDLPRLKQHGAAARRLQAAVLRLDKYHALGIGTKAERDRLAQLLGAIVEELELREAAQLIERPLEPSRVLAFRDAVLSGIAQLTDSFAGLLHHCASDMADGLTEPPSLFGVHSLAPKEYFVTTDVHADPASLGETIAGSVLRGEDRLALESIMVACTSESLGERPLLDAISRTVHGFKEARDLQVVIFRNVNWWIELRTSMKQDMGRGFNEPFEVDGVTYRHHRSVDLRGALVADLARLACYSRVVAPDDEQRADELAQLSVDVVSPAEAEQMARAKKDSLTGEELSVEKRRLQQKVRVRVLVRPLVEVLDPAAGKLILLDSGEAEEV